MAKINPRRIIEQLKDLLLFREGSRMDNILTPPTVTTGSIVWGILLRSAIIIIITTFLVMLLELRELAWFGVFLFWCGAVYPAYRQYTKFHERLAELRSDTLCGKCRYFIAESQLCSILDEHISMDTIPCDGQNWEASPDIMNTFH